jgi:hypothetical protein
MVKSLGVDKHFRLFVSTTGEEGKSVIAFTFVIDVFNVFIADDKVK